MALFAGTLFAFALVLSVASIVATILPARERILRLLTEGPEWTVDPLPPVRLTSRRGVIRQRMAPAVPALRAAA